MIPHGQFFQQRRAPVLCVLRERTETPVGVGQPGRAAVFIACCAAFACAPLGSLDEYSSGSSVGRAGASEQSSSASDAGAGAAGGSSIPSDPTASGAGSPASFADASTPPAPAGGSLPPSDAPSPGDTSSPRVVSSVPADGASGVRRDTSLAIAFDEPMDRASVEAAFHSDSLPARAPEFRWDAAGMLLNVVLDAPLSYAAGGDPNQVAAIGYDYLIGSAARDLAGNSLPETRISFTTLREISVRVGAQADATLTGNWRSDGVYGTDSCALTGSNMCIGDSSFGPDASYRGFASFDLSALPAALAEISQAKLELQVGSILGSPFAGLGPLALEHVQFAAIGPEAFLAPALTQLGSVTTSQIGTTLSLDVSSAVRADLAGEARSQYRLRFSKQSDADGSTDLLFSSRASASLSVSYLIP